MGLANLLHDSPAVSYGDLSSNSDWPGEEDGIVNQTSQPSCLEDGHDTFSASLCVEDFCKTGYSRVLKGAVDLSSPISQLYTGQLRVMRRRFDHTHTAVVRPNG